MIDEDYQWITNKSEIDYLRRNYYLPSIKGRNCSPCRTKRHEKSVGEKKPSSCELCGSLGDVVFDHCHASQKFRGWLCRNCNFALGHAKDNPVLLRKMADYLEQNRITLDPS